MAINPSSGGLPPSPYINIPPYYPTYQMPYIAPYPYSPYAFPTSPYPAYQYPPPFFYGPPIGPPMMPPPFSPYLPFTGWWIPREDLPPEAGGGEPGGGHGGTEGHMFFPGNTFVA